MSMVGKMSVGICRADSEPPSAISIAITTNVYGFLRAVLINHIGGSSVPRAPPVYSSATVRNVEKDS